MTNDDDDDTTIIRTWQQISDDEVVASEVNRCASFSNPSTCEWSDSMVLTVTPSSPNASIFTVCVVCMCFGLNYMVRLTFKDFQPLWGYVREVFFYIAFCIVVCKHGIIVLIWFFNKHTDFGWIYPIHDDEIIRFPNFVCYHALPSR